MKRVALVALIGMLLLPGAASAGSSTDAALGLGAFAVFNQVLSGTGVFGLGRQPVVIERQVIVAPPSVVYAPPPPPVVYAPVPPPPPVVYAPASSPVVVYPAASPVVVYPALPPGVVYVPAPVYGYYEPYRHYGHWRRHQH